MPEITPSYIEIREALRQPLAPIEITHGYRGRLAAVVAGLALLQALYLLLVAGVGYLTWLYTVWALGLGISLNLFTLVIYAGPPIAGAIATVFLLKPLVIRPPRAPQPLQLRPEDEPMLFEYVGSVCRALSSPRPSRIFVDLRANASASVRGWRGFFLGDLDLTIGLPFAAGLTLPQFTGVLAHEFGHFAQRTGMRSYFLIQTIQLWFARVVYQRDAMDTWLQRQRAHRDFRIKGIASVAGLAVTGGRKYLALLMRAGAWISAAFSRQMEFDADRHEVAMVGMDVFEQTSRQIPLLTAGANLAWQDVTRDWSVGRLPEDVAHLAAARTKWLSHEISEKIVASESSLTTGRLDTHPCMSERIASARATGLTGVFNLPGSAASLFRDLPELCRIATLHHYQNVLQVKDGVARMVPVHEAIANAEAERDYSGAVEQLFRTTPEFCSRWFRLPLGDPRQMDGSGDSEQPEPSFDANAYDSAIQTNLLQFAALMVRQSGIRVNPASFCVPADDVETIRQQESITTRNLNLALEQNRRTAAHIARRMESSMARLLNGDWGLAVPASRSTEIPNLRAAWRCYGALSNLQGEVMDIRRYRFAVQIVRENARVFPAAVSANLIDDLESRALVEIDKILGKTSGIPATVQFDPRVPTTVDGQLKSASDSRSERIQTFLARVDVLAARTLGQLAWFTVSSCPMDKPPSNLT